MAEIFENLAFIANTSNLVLYLRQYIHITPSKATNNVTNFMGFAFLLGLLRGFLSDAFLPTYHIYLISVVIELSVMVVVPKGLDEVCPLCGVLSQGFLGMMHCMLPLFVGFLAGYTLIFIQPPWWVSCQELSSKLDQIIMNGFD
ncbi:hypothetical protein Fmac_008390 [Flemingia macrophylla]|uniref:Uncharacterized protein n=1 Tax=Flemingia macrophylla TaxID=520843 RepID=A0ABD1MXA7_9FABA